MMTFLRCRKQSIILHVALVSFAWVTTVYSQLDDSWTLSINGQTVPVSADGSFVIPNISLVDSDLDGLGDQFFRIEGTSNANGIVRWTLSDFFQIPLNGALEVGSLTITDRPPLTPISMTLGVCNGCNTTLAIGETVQLETLALVSGDMTIDVTPRAAWTTYSTSNDLIATVAPDGLVTAQGVGVVFVTATNNGVATTKRLNVFTSTVDTTITGLVRMSDDSPADGVTITVLGGLGTTVTGADGSFSILVFVGNDENLFVRADVVSKSMLLIGSVGLLLPVADGFTDAGVIFLGRGTNDMDGDCIPDQIELNLGLNPDETDSDGNGILDGDEDTDGDLLANCVEIVLGTDPGLTDTDGDGLDDGDELLAGLDPTSLDSDGDGFIDGEEIEFGSDPLDPASIPIDPGDLIIETPSALFTIYNTTPPDPNNPSLESPSALFSMYNQVLPDPNMPVIEVPAALFSMYNQTLPDPNNPNPEFVGPLFSIENLNQP